MENIIVPVQHMPPALEVQTQSQAGNPGAVFDRVQCRIPNQLNVRRNSHVARQLQTVEEFGGVLIVQPDTKDLLRWLRPVQANPPHIAAALPEVTDTGADRAVEQRTAAIGIAEPEEW